MQSRSKYVCFALNVSFDVVRCAQLGVTLSVLTIFCVVFHGMRTTQA